MDFYDIPEGIRSPRAVIAVILLVLIGYPVVKWYQHRVDAFYANVCPHDGEVEEKYPNGIVAAQRTCAAGKIEGIEKTWFDNGVLRTEGPFVGGKRHGKWTLYDRNGQITRREEWTNGVVTQRLQ